MYTEQCRIVANTSRFTSISPIRRALHWLPVEHRSIFKTATLVYKFIHTGSPQYFSPYLMLYKGTYQTRHATRKGDLLVVPKFHPSVHKSQKQFGYSMAFDAPSVWNGLLMFDHPPQFNLSEGS